MNSRIKNITYSICFNCLIYFIYRVKLRLPLQIVYLKISINRLHVHVLSQSKFAICWINITKNVRKKKDIQKDKNWMVCSISTKKLYRFYSTVFLVKSFTSRSSSVADNDCSVQMGNAKQEFPEYESCVRWRIRCLLHFSEYSSATFTYCYYLHAKAFSPKLTALLTAMTIWQFSGETKLIMLVIYPKLRTCTLKA